MSHPSAASPMATVSLPASPAASLAPHQTAALQRALRYVDDHLAQPLRVTELAEAACVSRFHLVRLFRSGTGASPLRYVRRRRIQRACQLAISSAASAPRPAAAQASTWPAMRPCCFPQKMFPTESIHEPCHRCCRPVPAVAHRSRAGADRLPVADGIRHPYHRHLGAAQQRVADQQGRQRLQRTGAADHGGRNVVLRPDVPGTAGDLPGPAGVRPDLDEYLGRSGGDRGDQSHRQAPPGACRPVDQRLHRRPGPVGAGPGLRGLCHHRRLRRRVGGSA
ncbi:hypothetical protein G6F31_015335 [Rhizopus arrhizus]|nr:hypothetical protein G6F31_015335 [Rhizopus arrhizus]